MLHLHDVWVNWFEGEECGMNVCEFHEWRKSDHVELLEQVALLKINSDLYRTIENGMNELPNQLLKDIYQQSFIRRKNERSVLDYCAVITDGVGILTIDTIGYTIPIRKSRIVPRHEQQILEQVAKLEATYYEFDPLYLVTQKNEINALAPHPSALHGLTRKERGLKKLLLLALEHVYLSQNVSEIRYWFTEWFPEKYHEARHADFEEVWSSFYEAISVGWTHKHELFCEKIIKGQNYLEQLWDIEIGERPYMK